MKICYHCPERALLSVLKEDLDHREWKWWPCPWKRYIGRTFPALALTVAEGRILKLVHTAVGRWNSSPKPPLAQRKSWVDIVRQGATARKQNPAYQYARHCASVLYEHRSSWPESPGDIWLQGELTGKGIQLVAGWNDWNRRGRRTSCVVDPFERHFTWSERALFGGRDTPSEGFVSLLYGSFFDRRGRSSNQDPIE